MHDVSSDQIKQKSQLPLEAEKCNALHAALISESVLYPIYIDSLPRLPAISRGTGRLRTGRRLNHLARALPVLVAELADAER